MCAVGFGSQCGFVVLDLLFSVPEYADLFKTIGHAEEK
jgi:hypothetical protein